LDYSEGIITIHSIFLSTKIIIKSKT